MAKTSNYLFKLDLMILSLLKEKDQYAYELTKEIAEKSKGRIEPKNGTMYPIIYKLIENGYISSNTVIYHNKARVYSVLSSRTSRKGILRQDYCGI